MLLLLLLLLVSSSLLFSWGLSAQRGDTHPSHPSHVPICANRTNKYRRRSSLVISVQSSITMKSCLSSLLWFLFLLVMYHHCEVSVSCFRLQGRTSWVRISHGPRGPSGGWDLAENRDFHQFP